MREQDPSLTDYEINGQNDTNDIIQMREDPDLFVLHSDLRFVKLVSDLLNVPSQPYWLASREVTRGEYEAFLDDISDKGERPKDAKEARPYDSVSPTLNHPAQNVSWSDAVMYCNWLSRRESRTPAYRYAGKQKTKDENGREIEVEKWEELDDATGYRLPRELEWEYACRAGSETHWSTGSDESLLASYCQMYPSKLATPSGKKLPNAWGMHDMHGNVWEWCWDLVDQQRSDRVFRGGSWGDEAADCRSVYMYGYRGPSWRMNSDGDFGFRVALSDLGISRPN
jgi:formylglycine-generating enzyme required for sulfatase activity